MKDALRGMLFTALAAAFALTSAAAQAPRQAWVASWGSSQMALDAQIRLDPTALTDATVRQVVRLSVGGSALRIRLSNAYGPQPLTVVSVHVALAAAPGSAAIDPLSDRAVTFDGQAGVIVPASAEYVSDPVTLNVPALTNVAITIRYREAPAVQTGHPGSRTTSFYLAGDHVGDVDMPDAVRFEHWYQLAAVEVLAARTPVVAVIGDSITDGYRTTTDANNRWTDILAERLKGRVGVLNFGIGGNRLLNDGLGPNVLARFEREVFGVGGVDAVILFEGVNDLGTLTREAPATAAQHAALVARIIGAYRQIVLRAHEHGIKVYGATITPFSGSDYYHPTAENEADRQAINAWIRTPGHFDGVIDFDAALRDPAHPDRLRPEYDCGDHLHPSLAGYRALGEAVPLSLLTK